MSYRYHLTPYITSVFDPNYDTATQNFENRNANGELEYRNINIEDFNVQYTYDKDGITQKKYSGMSREQGRDALMNAGLKYYSTLLSGGGVLNSGKVASWFLWGGGAAIDSYSVYQTGDYSQGSGSVVGIPLNRKPGAIIGAGITIYNNFIRE